eukprot:CAMPEP_0194096330 /NCGR_PEP_ID=MMETSP0149-20130528/57283_1 /TAXON_ID=122233 /ORGANISM="Chaetoceros debilis, Strain MM31A-1" /LENGTH=253 /DNA_ID=CAMNT_0038782301 /DNA_START=764 /DNA_END=1525 /DNA_ORIENTATION=-
MKFPSFTLATIVALSLCITPCTAKPVADEDFVEEKSLPPRRMKIRFDNVNIENEPAIPYTQFRGFVFNNMVAVNGAKALESWGPVPDGELVGFGEAATSQPNFVAPADFENGDTEMRVACFGGTFDLLSVMLMPVVQWEEDGVSTPPPLVATIYGLDINFNLVARQSVTLDITKEGTPTKVKFGKVFENLSMIGFLTEKLNGDEGNVALYGVDNLQIIRNSSCGPPPAVVTSSNSAFDELIRNFGAVKSSSWY